MRYVVWCGKGYYCNHKKSILEMKQLFLYLFAAAIGSGVTYVCCQKDQPEGKLKFYFYGGDIFYVDIDKMHFSVESGRVDSTFTDIESMSKYIEDVSIQFYEEAITYEIGAALQHMDVTPKGSGMRVHTKNHYTDEDIEVYLNAREEDTYFLLD